MPKLFPWQNFNFQADERVINGDQVLPKIKKIKFYTLEEPQWWWTWKLSTISSSFCKDQRRFFWILSRDVSFIYFMDFRRCSFAITWGFFTISWILVTFHLESYIAFLRLRQICLGYTCLAHIKRCLSICSVFGLIYFILMRRKCSKTH